MYTEILYAPNAAKLALMSGQTVTKMFVPLPAGATAVYAGTSLSYYRHPDWLGSSRVASTAPTTPPSTVDYDGSYAPFGESYNESGTIVDRNFTGQNQDLGAVQYYDFLYREHNVIEGRWISPDPAGLAAVDPTLPQTWNRYAYVANDPLNFVDPFGLDGVCGPNGTWMGEGCYTYNGNGSGSMAESYANYVGGVAQVYALQNKTLAGSQWLDLLGLSGMTVTWTETRFNGQLVAVSPPVVTGGNAWDWCGSQCGATISGVSDFSAGAGDWLSVGVTTLINRWTGGQSGVNTKSNAYMAGVATGVGVSTAGTALAAGRVLFGLQTKIAIDSAHHAFELIGNVPHLQITWWLAGVSGSNAAIRIPLTPWWP
ncbi:MAG: RHS repeat-associated core domain-containing protein [Bryobacteraceae bacterium]